MKNESLSSIKDSLSDVRFEAYRKSDSESDLDVMARYMWNVALAEAFYTPLHSLEVCFRNSLHSSASNYFGTDKWIEPNWIDPKTKKPVLKSRENRKVKKAKKYLERRGKALTPDRIVAELTFGFWTSLLSGQYEKHFLYKVIKKAFPHMPNRIRTRSTLAGRFNDIRKFRNRIFHHEPIWYRDLMKEYNEILEAIEWICPEFRHLVEKMSCVQQAHNGKMNDLKTDLKAVL